MVLEQWRLLVGESGLWPPGTTSIRGGMGTLAVSTHWGVPSPGTGVVAVGAPATVAPESMATGRSTVTEAEAIEALKNPVDLDRLSSLQWSEMFLGRWWGYWISRWICLRRSRLYNRCSWQSFD